MEQEIANITSQIANKYVHEIDKHIECFLKKNMIPFDGNIEKTNNELKSRGMRLISESNNAYFDNNKTTYMLVKIIDSTSVTFAINLGVEKE